MNKTRVFGTALMATAVFLTGTTFANENMADLEPVQTIESLHAETFVTVQGTVKKIQDEDEFILQDGTGKIKVYIGPNRMPVRVGDVVTVNGMFDRGVLRDEIYAHTIIDDKGEANELRKGY